MKHDKNCQCLLLNKPNSMAYCTCSQPPEATGTDESTFINPLTSNDPKAIELVEAMRQQMLTDQ